MPRYSAGGALRVDVAVVVPCFDEEHRLDVEKLIELSGRVRLILVDDGSRDGTAGRLRDVPGAETLHLARNVGKGEAVRRGLVLAEAAAVVGYLDADLPTPLDEALALADPILADEADAVLGSRILRAGAGVQRTWQRHLAGRAFATVASWSLRAPIHDTQCGAKFFRNDARLRAAIAQPFGSRWAFDVELLRRLLSASPAARLLEVPLREWRDVPGSKLSLGRGLWTVGEVVRMRFRT